MFPRACVRAFGVVEVRVVQVCSGTEQQVFVTQGSPKPVCDASSALFMQLLRFLRSLSKNTRRCRKLTFLMDSSGKHKTTDSVVFLLRISIVWM